MSGMVSLRGPTWVAAAGFVLIAVGLGFLATGAPIVGIGFCVLAVGLAGAAVRNHDETSSMDLTSDDDSDDALSTLRERYARGELTDAQFEAKLERLVEVETLEDVVVTVERRESNAETDVELNRE
ncbi:Predicted membrane protein (DUF2078) [Halogeometricum borinquense DSM 11551]|uniref:Predicted membrane protein (DUF2078) n=2 Tax=Halogeometricum borinquense (strain ATCC 700274 / DSM 11551 / JCM 10706 / KCTC 4070 / PR3) TaxID=469382 RepID=E4NSY7_HALBP|nr:Predicted membrane protein (DUF2078) [Halogeometricum borinquense DSM 11551]